MAFLEKLTLTPSDVGPEDVRSLLAQGISREAVLDACYVCYLFCTYDRLADALGWDIPEPEAFVASAKMLLKRGYK